MTKAEILKQIEELKEQVIMLTEDDVKLIRTMPKYNDSYFSINIDYANLIVDETAYLDFFDEHTSSIGNYFKSEDDAKMVIKAMQLEQAIRIRRIELNNGWEPDWNDVNEVKYFIFYGNNKYIKNDILPEYTYGFNDLPIFGYYETYEIAQQVIDEFEDDLRWYFTEYYPNKDKMYVWGEKQ